VPYVRFDDLRAGRIRSFGLDGFQSVVEARRIDEVKDVLSQAEAEVRAGRWVAGWVSYEAAPAFHRALRVRQTQGTPFSDLPLAWFGVFDRRRPVTSEAGEPYEIGCWESTVGPGEHGSTIEGIRERIRAGDTYQVNYTFRMQAPFQGDVSTFYRDLIQSQRGGYGAFVDTGRWAVLSASPELFFEWEEGQLVSKPMKGTAARGRDLVEDHESSSRLRESEKEQAENVMIVDMVRNDMGRIAQAGSVEVPVLFDTEKYDTVWQLTSTVRALTTDGATLGDVFSALFPPASITGAPKASTMEMITDFESSPRGVYCGAIGFGGPNRSGDPRWAFNVGIRTVLVDLEAATAWYGTGGGITIESEPGDEYREAVLKTRVLSRQSSGFSLIETIRWSSGEGFRQLGRHLIRLSRSARYFDIEYDPQGVEIAVHEAVAGRVGTMRVNLALDRGGKIDVSVSPAPAVVEGPLQVVIDDVPVDPSDPFLRHKTTRRDVYRQAAARHPAADDVILVNGRGEITETTIANVVAELGGRWVTPPVESGCLPGIERQRLLELDLVGESVIAASDLRRATRLARVNSLRGWEPIVLADVAYLESATG
jgi:para-aminobenzoate synthetase/4-amino-4-deoxychorismate lyase